MSRYRDRIVLTDNLGFEQDYSDVKEAAHAAVTWYQEFYKSIEEDLIPEEVLQKVLDLINWFDPSKIQTVQDLDSYLFGLKIQLVRLLAPVWRVSIKQAAEAGWLVVHPITKGHWTASVKMGMRNLMRLRGSKDGSLVVLPGADWNWYVGVREQDGWETLRFTVESDFPDHRLSRIILENLERDQKGEPLLLEASTRKKVNMHRRRVADRLSDAIDVAESKMRQIETRAATNLKGALGSLASYLELLNLQPEQLKDAAESDDILMELIMDDELLWRLSSFADKLHTYTEGAAQAAGEFMGVHEDLMELQDMWQERKQKEREMASLPGAPEARDYQQVQSLFQRNRRRFAKR